MIITEIPTRLLKMVSGVGYIQRTALKSPNPFSAYVRQDQLTDERWRIEFELPTLERDDADLFDSVFDAGDGVAGFYSAFIPGKRTMKGTIAAQFGIGTQTFDDLTLFDDGTGFTDGSATGAITVTGARGSEFITIGNLDPSITNGFRIGDMVSISQNAEPYGFLHRILGDASSNAIGEATLRIRPRLREAVSVGQKVSLIEARGVFQLMPDAQAVINRRYGHFGEGGSLSLIEVPEVLLCSL